LHCRRLRHGHILKKKWTRRIASLQPKCSRQYSWSHGEPTSWTLTVTRVGALVGSDCSPLLVAFSRSSTWGWTGAVTISVVGTGPSTDESSWSASAGAPYETESSRYKNWFETKRVWRLRTKLKGVMRHKQTNEEIRLVRSKFNVIDVRRTSSTIRSRGSGSGGGQVNGTLAYSCSSSWDAVAAGGAPDSKKLVRASLGFTTRAYSTFEDKQEPIHCTEAWTRSKDRIQEHMLKVPLAQLEQISSQT
jgi:hypothetical protein